MNHKQTGSTIVTKAMCATFFIIFTYIYLYCYQATTLMYLQRVLSDGKTSYGPFLGGLIITGVLMIVQWCTSNLLRLKDLFHTLTYVPSFLLLILLTDIEPQYMPMGYIGGVDTGMFVWFIPVIIAIYAIAIVFARQWIPVIQKGGGPLSATHILVSILTMTIMAGSTCLLGNGDHTFHARIKAEKCLMSQDYDGTLKALKTSHEADTTLTLYRFIALSQHGKLADSLFCAPVCGNRESVINYKNIYLGILPQSYAKLEVGKILNHNTQRKHDYELCALLLGKEIDSFAQQLPRYYAINDSLPTHYKEALILYQHIRSNHTTNYVDSVMEIDYNDMQQIVTKYRTRHERHFHFRRQYANTYWAYFFTAK